MNDIDRTLLEEPFDQDLIRTRRGHHGKEISYVPAHEYIHRLNEAFGARWDFDVTEHRILEDEVVVLGRLVAGGVTKTAFGGSSITRAKDGGQPLSISDDLKAAASDALKKACSLLGIGLHLYGDGQPAPQASEPGVARMVHIGPGADATRNGGTDKADNRDGHRLTQRQLAAIWAITDSRDIPRPHTRQYALDTWQRQPEFLTKEQASLLIGHLQQA